jgi:hypothetical protein
VDEEVRRQQRAALLGDPRAIGEWIRARRRAGEARPVPREGDHVRGEHLAALLTASLDGRREVEALREAVVPDRRHGRLIEGLRALARGELRPWSVVAAWATVLRLDIADLALVAEVVRPVPRPRPQPTPHPLASLPERACCGRCNWMVWAVGCGAGVRCGNPASPVGLGGLIPGLHRVCPAFEGPRFDSSH